MKLRTRIVAMLATLFSMVLAAGNANAQVRVTIGNHPRVFRETEARPFYGYRDYGHHYGLYKHQHMDRDEYNRSFNGTYNRRDFDNRNYHNDYRR